MKNKKENKLVVANLGWAETIPEWLLEEVKYERLIYGLAGFINPNAPKVGDAETLVYLYTEALTQPLDNEKTNIYLYLTAKVMKRRRELPDFLKEALERGLTEYEQYELQNLKHSIYIQRGGEIKNPLLDAMRELKKEIDRGKKMKVKSLFAFGNENKEMENDKTNVA